MKKTILFVLLTTCFAVSVFAQPQQLTRFAVVDMARVYSAFFREARAVREFEEQSTMVQAEIDRLNREIQELRSRRADAVLQGDQEQAFRLESEISRRTDAMREYYNLRTAELAEQRRRLAQSGSFLEQVHRAIQTIAQSEGYTMVLNLTENAGILWYSPSVDITRLVIDNLTNRRR